MTPPSPYSYLLEGNAGFGIPGPKTLLDGTCQLLLFLQPEMLGCTRSRRTDGQVPPALQFPAPWRLGPLAQEKAPGREEWCICGWWFKGGIFSEAPFLCSSSLRPQQACPLSPPQVHPMTPSLGVTPDEAQLPAGPPAHRGGHIWAVPSPVGLAIWGADFGSGSPWGVGPGLGSFPRGLSSPSTLLLLPHCCKYFNEIEKKKKRQRKSHHLKPPGACSLASPGFLRSRAAPLGPGSQDCSVYVCIPRRGGRAARAAFYNSETKKSRSNSETKNPFPSRHLFLSPPSLLCLPLASVSPPGACTSLPAPGPGACLPPPLPSGPGEAPLTPKDAFAKMAALSL